jgi:2'-5' RNA ligase
MAGGQTTNAFICLRVPSALVEELGGLQQDCQDYVDPQEPEHIHITLGFLHGAGEQKLAAARSCIEQGTWPAPVVRLTGEVRHGSWSLQKDPAYRYDESTVQKGEQVRLGVEYGPELARIHEEITQGLEIAEDDFWPHVTLGLAREDFPATKVKSLNLPQVGGPAPSVDVQREVSSTEFTTLVRKDLNPT